MNTAAHLLCAAAGWGLALLVSAGAAEPPLREVIDGHLASHWKKSGVATAGRASDATFLRRAFLDLVGTIPTYDEARGFLDDKALDKRARLIASLMADERYPAQQAQAWDLALFGRNPPNSDATRNRSAFRQWLTGKLARNEPFDQWVRALLLAEEDGSELFYVQFQNRPEDLTEVFSRIFLGTQLQCARCHDHPYSKLTQQDFFGMAGFFVRLVSLDQGTTGSGNQQVRRFRVGEKRSGEVLFAGNMKEAQPGRKGDPVKPRFLGGAALDEPALPAGFKEPEVKTGTKSLPKPDFSRKEKLAEWATTPANPYFARAAVNRLWARFMGRGIVHPVDDFGADTPPTHPELLDALTREFIAHKFDLNWIIGEIVNTRAYQMDGGGPAAVTPPKHFERARIRPLTAEELQAALRTAGGTPADTDNVRNEYFLRYFGDPNNGQGDFQGGLGEHLFLNNSDNVRNFLRRKKGNFADSLLLSTEPWEARVDRMFLTVLTRLPSAAERAKFVAYLQSDTKPEPLVEEALWVLVNLGEFRFNH